MRAYNAYAPAYEACCANPNQMNQVMLKSSRVHVLLTPATAVRLVMRDGAHAANQSTPLMPAQPKNAEQSARDGRWLGNYRAIYLDIIDLCSAEFPASKYQSQD